MYNLKIFSIFTDLWNHHHNQFENFFLSFSKEISYTLAVILIPRQFPRPKQPLVIMSLWIFLFWTSHTNKIIHYVIFCDWPLSLRIMLLRFIHVVAWISTFFLLITEYFLYKYTTLYSFPHGSDSKESTCNVGDLGSIPGSRRSPREANGYPLHYSGLENPMDRGAWRATVHGVTKSWMQLTHKHTHTTLYWLVCQLMDTWVVSTSMNNATMNIHTQVFTWTYVLIYFDIYLGVESFDCTWPDLIFLINIPSIVLSFTKYRKTQRKTGWEDRGCICSSVLSKVHEDIQNQMIYSNQCDWVKIFYKEKVFWKNSNLSWAVYTNSWRRRERRWHSSRGHSISQALVVGLSMEDLGDK